MRKKMTIAELRRTLAARERQVARLLARRRKLAKQLAAVDRDVEALGGKVPKATRPKGRVAKRGTRRLPRNVKPLPEYIKDVLAKSKAGMRVKDVEAAVKAAGYKTFSKDFYGAVAVVLREGPFVKVSRGVYKLKAAKKVTKRKAAKKAPPKRATRPKVTKKEAAH